MDIYAVTVLLYSPENISIKNAAQFLFPTTLFPSQS